MTRKRFDSAPHINVKDEGLLLQQVAGSTANLLEVKSHNGSTLMAVDYSGTMTSGASNSFTYLAATTSASLPANTTIGNVSPTELGYLDGVTSALQTQLNAKSPLASPTFTGTVTLPSDTSIGTVSATELGYLDGVTSALQTQLNSKLSTAVTSLTAGTGIGLSGGTGAVTVSNTGVTSVAGTSNQITVSAGTGGVTISLPNTVTIGGPFTAINGGVDGGWSMRTWTANASFISIATRDMTGAEYCLLSDGIATFVSSGAGGVTYMRAGGNDTSGQVAVRTSNVDISGTLNTNGISNSGHISSGSTGLSYSGSISCTNWFRSTGGSGWYNETYVGGIWMYDNWVRIYNNKPFYSENEVRTGNVFSGNAGRSRGSYGAISIGGNGITNTWDGIEFSSPQTFMIQGDNYAGVFRNNNTWNWLFNYGTLVYGSDERYKRDIQPLNAGLNFIENLNPISFLKLTENPDDDPEATELQYYYGFSAQNVRYALDAIGETRDVKIHDIGGPNMGLIACTEDAVYDRQYIGITEFIAPLVQAVKELSSKIEYLEGEVVRLSAP